jgi:hypothetical protein
VSSRLSCSSRKRRAHASRSRRRRRRASALDDSARPVAKNCPAPSSCLVVWVVGVEEGTHHSASVEPLAAAHLGAWQQQSHVSPNPDMHIVAASFSRNEVGVNLDMWVVDGGVRGVWKSAVRAPRSRPQRRVRLPPGRGPYDVQRMLGAPLNPLSRGNWPRSSPCDAVHRRDRRQVTTRHSFARAGAMCSHC